ncbi:MAG: glycosyltransferase family 4 protein, partial [Waddliaceae bacterium]
MSANKPSGGIAYVLRKFPVLSETFILNEILALEERGVPLHIFSLERPNDPRFHEDVSKIKANITYLPPPFYFKRLCKHSFRTIRYFSMKYFKALSYALKYPHRPTLLLRFLQGCYIANHLHKLDISHIHSHFANRPTSAAFFTSLITGIPYSFTAHAVDIFKKTMSKKTLAKKIANAKFVITVSDYNKRFLENVSNAHSEKIVRIYNGINLENFVSKTDQQAKSKRFTLLCISRLVEKKGIPVLVEACKYLRDRKVDFDCTIVGTGKLRKT